ncbi:CU044_5270 family protein [Streptomyces pratensis]|uniref:CU044_5270 family protein n=1 Tax=Streptomyces pratensis TaxID=1169025 RepID=UPI0030178850
MDEMTRLRELRADAPVPDRAALAPGRKRLTDAIAGEGRRAFRLRAHWRVASLGAAAAITAAVLVLTQAVGGPPPRPAGPATVAGDLDLSGPAAALNRAAEHLELLEVPPEPRPDQWIYVREVHGQPDRPTLPDGSEFPVSFGGGEPDSWVPYDDEAAADDTSDTDYRTARESYRIAAALPDDPKALLSELREAFPTGDGTNGEAEGEDEHTFRAASVLLGSYPLPPDALARIYRALATVGGVDVTDHLVKDAAGREVIAVTREHDEQPTRREILIDPVGYGYAGTRDVVTEEHALTVPGGLSTEPSPVHHPGDVLYSVARTHAAVVDAKGEKP